jgi:hypothetical protein
VQFWIALVLGIWAFLGMVVIVPLLLLVALAALVTGFQSRKPVLRRLGVTLFMTALSFAATVYWLWENHPL